MTRRGTPKAIIELVGEYKRKGGTLRKESGRMGMTIE